MARQKKKVMPKDPVSEYLSEIGRRGGQAKVPKGAAALSPEEMAERSKKMAEARWGKNRAKKTAK
jgi:hypothetical protein